MKKRIKSFGYAGRGIREVFRSEINMRIHVAVTVCVILAGFFFSISTTEWIICIVCMGLVMGLEAMNTAIENTIDLLSPEHHPLAGKAKDAAAGAVLIATIAAVIVGIIIFLPKLQEYSGF